MYNKDYLTKFHDFISNSNIEEIKKDPTKCVQVKVKKLINKSKVLFTNNDTRHLWVMNPVPQIPSGLPKIHKEGVPIRPLWWTPPRN